MDKSYRVKLTMPEQRYQLLQRLAMEMTKHGTPTSIGGVLDLILNSIEFPEDIVVEHLDDLTRAHKLREVGYKCQTCGARVESKSHVYISDNWIEASDRCEPAPIEAFYVKCLPCVYKQQDDLDAEMEAQDSADETLN